MEHFSLKIQGSPLLFIFILIGMIGLSIFVYRHTNPPVPAWLKRILKILRVASLILIIFILFEPILSLSWYRIENPVSAVLLDNSASMSLTDNGIFRSEKAKAILRSNFFQNASHDNDYEFYQFSDKLSPLSLNQLDSVQFNHDGTDLTEALKELKEKNVDRYLRSVVLITDGIDNLGENPVRYVEDYDIPIFPIAIGKAIEQKDVLISKLTTNQITYATTNVPVDVTAQAFGYPGQKIEVKLLKGSEIQDSKSIEVTKDPFETRVQLQFTPKEPGYQKYQIQIPALNDELTTVNNQKNFYTKVLKSKMQILFVAGSPDPDFKLMKKNLEADPNMEINYWVVKKNQQFYQGVFPCNPDELKRYDCIILQNFPGKNISLDVITALKKTLESNQIPLLFVAGNNIHYQSLLPLQNFLPIAPPFYESQEFLAVPRLTTWGLVHPITRIVADELENQQKWKDMPPIYLALQKTQLYPGSETLIETDPEQTRLRGAKESLPLIIGRKMGQHKSIAILAYGIWRWDLLMWGIGKSNEVFKQLLNNCVRWLITKEDSKPVRIYPDQEIYRNGQRVTFTGQIYYEDYRPMDGAEVKLKANSKKKTYEISLSGIGDGKYEGALQALEGGDYNYEGTATYNDRLIGSDQGQFSVEDFHLEFLQTKMNETLLQQLALKSGGTFLTDSSYSSLESLLKYPVRRTLETREFQLWNKLVLLLAVIIFLSIEWFIRKRSGML